ncbi:hypothetical protein BGX23_000043 [Mortierella sp. AD031]|nr:hypothetical protein BGX23_000043 [Mortierella sp. AD031]
MFCPRLDSALVASIYHDMGDFKACIPILSALAAAASPSDNHTSIPISIINSVPTKNDENTSQNVSHNGKKQASPSTQPANNNNSNSKKKKANATTPSTDKNILIWSEEVANSNTTSSSSTARSGLFKPNGSNNNKQGQVTNSDSFQQPTTLVNSPATTQTAPKASYKATRNPRYMQKNVFADVPVAPVVDDQDDEDGLEGGTAKDEEQDLADEDALGGTRETLSAAPEPKKKKNRRQKRLDKAGKDGPTAPPLGGSSMRGTWRKDAITGRLGAGSTNGNDNDNSSVQNGGNDDEEAEDDDDDETASVAESVARNVNGIKAEELEFLKSCFPNQEHSDEYLAQVLKDCRRDLEAAVEMILSQMFLDNEQVETSSSGSGSFQSSTSTTTSSLDDAFFEGVQNRSKKKWRSTSASGGSSATDGVSAWGTRHQPVWGGQNDPLLKTMDRQDDFLIPESNEWATFDHQISILMNIFYTVPKKTIVSEYHANGAHLFKTVESIEARLKQENRNGPSAQGRERQTQFDINMAQLMEMFPDHSAVGLKKMLVYNGGNVQDAMNAVLAADFARADLNDRSGSTNGAFSKRGNVVIPFQADIRYADKNAAPTPTNSGNRLKSLPSTTNPYPNGVRPFPNTIVENSNADLYNDDDDPVWCRQQAHEMLEQRNELFRKAAKSYQLSKGKGVGMGGIAAYYADEGKKLDAQGKQWHMRAARAVVQQHRLVNNDQNLVDLHGLTISEAQTVVREAVTQWFSRATMQASRITVKPLKIICGVGSHSKDRIARLYPTILSLLQKDGWKIEAENGVILVKGVSRIMPSKK